MCKYFMFSSFIQASLLSSGSVGNECFVVKEENVLEKEVLPTAEETKSIVML